MVTTSQLNVFDPCHHHLNVMFIVPELFERRIVRSIVQYRSDTLLVLVKSKDANYQFDFVFFHTLECFECLMILGLDKCLRYKLCTGLKTGLKAKNIFEMECCSITVLSNKANI